MPACHSATSAPSSATRPNASATAPALRYRRYGLYHDYGWRHYHEDAAAAAAALVDVGVRPGDRVGLVGENRLDWLVADMAILAEGRSTSPRTPR
ncbi:MAG: AMP-binding protein [Gemmataceae bacterium]